MKLSSASFRFDLCACQDTRYMKDGHIMGTGKSINNLNHMRPCDQCTDRSVMRHIRACGRRMKLKNIPRIAPGSSTTVERKDIAEGANSHA